MKKKKLLTKSNFFFLGGNIRFKKINSDNPSHHRLKSPVETANGWINRIFIIIILTTYLTLEFWQEKSICGLGFRSWKKTYKSILKTCKSIRNTYQMIRWQASMPWRGTWEFPELDFLRIRVHDDDWAHHKYLQQRFQDTKKIIKKTLVFIYNIVELSTKIRRLCSKKFAI